MGAMDALRHRLGLRIPEDLMVGGFDDIRESARLSYQLTTVRQPIDEMIEETLAILNLDEPGFGHSARHRSANQRQSDLARDDSRKAARQNESSELTQNDRRRLT